MDQQPEQPKPWPISEEIAPDHLTRLALRFWTKRINRPLFVYCIQAVDGGPVKVGKAHNPVTRLAELQCGNPQKLVVRAVVLATVKTERLIHQTWRPVCHVHGEWFGHGQEDMLINLAKGVCEQQILFCERGTMPIPDIAGLSSQVAYPNFSLVWEAAA